MTDWDKMLPPGKPLESAKLIFTGIDLGSEDKSVEYVVKDGKIIDWVELPIERIKNKVPTHDPYTNPDSHIYYECGCGAILDPGTNRFAALNGHAEKAGWKIRFGPQHYIPYCMKCGEGVE